MGGFMDAITGGLSGAGMGSMFGPWGAAIGGVLGAGSGLLGGGGSSGGGASAQTEQGKEFYDRYLVQLDRPDIMLRLPNGGGVVPIMAPSARQHLGLNPYTQLEGMRYGQTEPASPGLLGQLSPALGAVSQLFGDPSSQAANYAWGSGSKANNTNVQSGGGGGGGFENIINSLKPLLTNFAT